VSIEKLIVLAEIHMKKKRPKVSIEGHTFET